MREHNCQVDRLREEDPGLTGDGLYDHARAIVGPSFADIIERTTDTVCIQDDAFRFHERHEAGSAAGHPGSPQLLVAGGAWLEMTGRGGGDRFVFVEPGQDVTVTDFKPGRDALVFDRTGDPESDDAIVTSSREGHALVRYAEHDVELIGVRPGQLDGGDFFF